MQVRLIHALLAFPIAGVIGFTGNAIVTNLVSDAPAIVNPAPPERSTDEHTSPRERGEQPDSHDSKAFNVG